MSEGYVVFVDDDPTYLELVDVLIESVLSFSTRPIELFSINHDFRHSSSRVLSRRVDIEPRRRTSGIGLSRRRARRKYFAGVCYTKLLCSLNSSFTYGIQLDSDFIITREMDTLFEEARSVGTTPLGSLHPADPCNQQALMTYLGVETKSQPYVHATYLFSSETRPFFAECHDVAMTLLRNGVYPGNLDETVLNVMLWKRGSRRWATCYDPYFEVFLNRDSFHDHGYGWMESINYYSCHGIKDPARARAVLEELIRGDEEGRS